MQVCMSRLRLPPEEVDDLLGECSASLPGFLPELLLGPCPIVLS